VPSSCATPREKRLSAQAYQTGAGDARRVHVARNLAKHGVSLEEAVTAFWDPLSATVADRSHSQGERRCRLFGQTVRGRIVVVTHVERGGSIS
jgi:uncharacterized DUF497 family protein